MRLRTLKTWYGNVSDDKLDGLVSVCEKEVQGCGSLVDEKQKMEVVYGVFMVDSRPGPICM